MKKMESSEKNYWALLGNTLNQFDSITRRQRWYVICKGLSEGVSDVCIRFRTFFRALGDENIYTIEQLVYVLMLVWQGLNEKIHSYAEPDINGNILDTDLYRKLVDFFF